jgi:hypothetical protein
MDNVPTNPGEALTKNIQEPLPSPEDLLDAAERGSGAGGGIARDAAVSDGAFAITLAVLIASFLLAVEYVFPTRNLVLMFGSVAAYGVGVLAVLLWNQRRRRASRQGWAKRYARGFAITMAFYAIGVALSVAPEPSSLAFWLCYALLTAAPLVFAAVWRTR